MLTCNLFRLLCKSWLIYSGLYFTGWLSSTLNYKEQNNATARNILYVFHSIGSLSTCIKTFKKKDGLNYFFICAYCWLFYYKQFIFLIAILVKRSSSWILWQKRLHRYHTFEILLICVVNLNTIIDISVTLLFTLFGCLKWLNEVYIHCFIVIQVIDDRIYFDLPSVQNVNSNNYFRCLYEWAVLFHWTQYTNRHLLIVCRQRSFSGLLCVCLCW